MQKYTFHNDPGHGWLEVGRDEIKGLAISGYSYQQGDRVYLEEDGDLALFLQAHPEISTSDFIDKYYDEDAPMRSMDCYSA